VINCHVLRTKPRSCLTPFPVLTYYRGKNRSSYVYCVWAFTKSSCSCSRSWERCSGPGNVVFESGTLFLNRGRCFRSWDVVSGSGTFAQELGRCFGTQNNVPESGTLARSLEQRSRSYIFDPTRRCLTVRK
jgi:hypothetical protein